MEIHEADKAGKLSRVALFRRDVAGFLARAAGPAATSIDAARSTA